MSEGWNVDPSAPPGFGILRLPETSRLEVGPAVSAEQIGPEVHLIGFAADDEHPMVAWLRGVLDGIERDERARVCFTRSGSGEYCPDESHRGYDAPAPISWVTITNDPTTSGFVAQPCGHDLNPETARPMLGEESAADRSVLARVEAERAIMRLHIGPHECSTWNDMHGEYDTCVWVSTGPCSAVEWLAYGHRFDADGYDPAWTPQPVPDDW